MKFTTNFLATIEDCNNFLIQVLINKDFVLGCNALLYNSPIHCILRDDLFVF